MTVFSNSQTSRSESSFYFSYDDSGSTASRDLTVFAIENGIKPNPSLGRPFEFPNAEDVGHFSPESRGPFEVSMGLLMIEEGAGVGSPEINTATGLLNSVACSDTEAQRTVAPWCVPSWP